MAHARRTSLQTKQYIRALESKYNHNASACQVVAFSASSNLQLPISELSKRDILLKIVPSKHLGATD